MDASVFLTTSWSLGCFSLGSLSLGSFSLGSFSWSFSWTCQDNGLEFRFQGPRSVLGARPKWALRHGSGLRTIAGKGMQNRVESTRIQNAKCCMSWAGSFWKVFLGGQTRLESKATVSRRERKTRACNSLCPDLARQRQAATKASGNHTMQCQPISSKRVHTTMGCRYKPYTLYER